MFLSNNIHFQSLYLHEEQSHFIHKWFITLTVSILYITSILCSSGHCIDRDGERRAESQCSPFSSWACADLRLYACRLCSDWGNHIMDTRLKWASVWQDPWSGRTSVSSCCSSKCCSGCFCKRHFSWQKLFCSYVEFIVCRGVHSHFTLDEYKPEHKIWTFKYLKKNCIMCSKSGQIGER